MANPRVSVETETVYNFRIVGPDPNDNQIEFAVIGPIVKIGFAGVGDYPESIIDKIRKAFSDHPDTTHMEVVKVYNEATMFYETPEPEPDPEPEPEPEPDPEPVPEEPPGTEDPPVSNG